MTNSSTELAGSLLAMTPPGTPLFEEREGLELLLRNRWEEARTAWPGFEVPADAWVEAIAGALDHSSTLVSVQELHTTDIYLAQACAMGHSAALAGFEVSCRDSIEASLRTMGLAEEVVTTVARDVRKNLFEGVGGPPRISTYSGRSELVTWTRTVTARAAMNRLSKGSSAAPEPAPQRSSTDGPAAQEFRTKHGTQLNDAFDEAMSSLDLKQRNVLRHHYVEDMPVEDICEMYNVPKSTAGRWLEEARTQLGKRTQARFLAKVKVASEEMDGVLKMLDQSIEISLRRTLLN